MTSDERERLNQLWGIGMPLSTVMDETVRLVPVDEARIARPALVAAVEELVTLRSEKDRLRAELTTARAQRDGLQRALDKANRDNDVLRAELRQLGVESQPTAATISKLLVDRGEGDYSWVEEPASGGGEGEGGSALSVRRPLDLSLDFDEIQRAIDRAMDKAKAIVASMTGGL